MDKPTERGENGMSNIRTENDNKKEAAKMAEIKAAIEQGKMTLNEARTTVGLEPLDNHVANVLFKRKG